ncbi:hypothetical protein E2C01_061341 [Portunus trituberculatus]|uniref:Uncharacterized protein n=1 Tax=Portunus trituberculatus TaxID=210409 RepID=A0A5B7HC65_PORTR|nr:hypothetical protein [Portunus trituberculatus]
MMRDSSAEKKLKKREVDYRGRKSKSSCLSHRRNIQLSYPDLNFSRIGHHHSNIFAQTLVQKCLRC